MPVSGLVAICPDPSEETLRALRDNARCTLGEMQPGGRLPVVLETAGQDEHRAQLHWLRELPGVQMVELAYADYRETMEDDDDG